jgi:hypothetical protein
MSSLYKWVDSDSQKIIIEDVGKNCMSVTNDIENILKDLHRRGLLRGRKLYYYDSEGDFTEALHESGVFKGYK